MSEPSSKPEDHTALYPDASQRVNDYLERFGSRVGTDFGTLDETGFAELRYGDLAIGVTVHKEGDQLMLLARVAEIPKDASATFFRQLLELNFVSTGACALSIDAEKPHVYLRTLRPLRGFSYGEFEVLLQTVATVAVDMRARLRDL